jgi:PadR family transcriptional regulator
VVFYLCRQQLVYIGRVRGMRSQTEFSPQTLSVLAALCEEPSAWRHGYALARQTGLKSGTLYPILIRLADRGLVEACWQQEPAPGRPRRHLYRLTAGGLASATAATAEAEQAAAQRAGLERAGTGAARPAAGPRRGRGVAAPAVP